VSARLGARDVALVERVRAMVAECGANVHNLPGLTREDVLALYADARALVFPSTSESFGLPLVEAQRCGLPIVAADLDYVHEVCTPVLRFDPLSAESIAQAVQGFLEAPSAATAAPPLPIATPQAFWHQLLLAEP
jgi:glycosyltransferase involved in cell wall biosynthesis